MKHLIKTTLAIALLGAYTNIAQAEDHSFRVGHHVVNFNMDKGYVSTLDTQDGESKVFVTPSISREGIHESRSEGSERESFSRRSERREHEEREFRHDERFERNERHARPSNGLCAVVYSRENFRGESLNIRENAVVPALKSFRLQNGASWNNRVSSVWVAPECKLVTFQYDNLGRDFETGRAIGKYQSFSGGEFEGYSFNDLEYMEGTISSLNCVCE